MWTTTEKTQRLKHSPWLPSCDRRQTVLDLGKGTNKGFGGAREVKISITSSFLYWHFQIKQSKCRWGQESNILDSLTQMQTEQSSGKLSTLGLYNQLFYVTSLKIIRNWTPICWNNSVLKKPAGCFSSKLLCWHFSARCPRLTSLKINKLFQAMALDDSSTRGHYPPCWTPVLAQCTDIGSIIALLYNFSTCF